MSDLVDNIENVDVSSEDPNFKRKKGAGIKSPLFTSTGNNGESHRKNAKKKHTQHLKNMVIRADLYRSKTQTGDKDWHLRLDALSMGTA